MSFSNNCKSDKIPGAIKGNAVNGICEKACIQCDKVLDMCMRQEALTDVSIVVSDITPASGLVEPYRFVSARTISSDAVVSDLVVTPLADNSCLARVTCNVTVPLQVVFVDANGTQAVGTSSVTIPKDVVLNIAAPSVMPYRVAASAGIVSPNGTYTGDNTFTITACATVILKVIIQVHLLVPSYGYFYIPQCQDYIEQTCDTVFDLPLYPQECGGANGCGTVLRG